MANETEIYSFEKNFIAALVEIVAVDSVQTVEFGNQQRHKTPRIEASFTYDGADETDRGITTAGEQYLRKHFGSIALKVSGSSKVAHLDLVGAVRNFMAWNAPTLIQPALEFYQVHRIFEKGSSNKNGEKEEDFEISTSLNFDVAFSIPKEAFDL